MLCRGSPPTLLLSVVRCKNRMGALSAASRRVAAKCSARMRFTMWSCIPCGCAARAKGRAPRCRREGARDAPPNCLSTSVASQAHNWTSKGSANGAAAASSKRLDNWIDGRWPEATCRCHCEAPSANPLSAALTSPCKLTSPALSLDSHPPQSEELVFWSKQLVSSRECISHFDVELMADDYAGTSDLCSSQLPPRKNPQAAPRPSRNMGVLRRSAGATANGSRHPTNTHAERSQALPRCKSLPLSAKSAAPAGRTRPPAQEKHEGEGRDRVEA